jgi:hypothetical protein
LFVLIFQHLAPFTVPYVSLTIADLYILSTFVTSICTTLFFTLFHYAFQYVQTIVAHEC